jgi:hypothetical protein
MTKTKQPERDPEILAIEMVYDALHELTAEAQARVLTYVARKLKLGSPDLLEDHGVPHERAQFRSDRPGSNDPDETTLVGEEGMEGISPVAKKWMTRNGLPTDDMRMIFSLDGDEIDLIAQAIPGTSKRDRMHSVILLLGIASYLGSGAARFTHDKLREACLHYKAYDSPNFARYLKEFSSEVSGDKSTAYSLTARGMSAATDIVKNMIGKK